jgi:hypothetical protein
MYSPYYGPHHLGVSHFPGFNPLHGGMGFNPMTTRNSYLAENDILQDTIDEQGDYINKLSD